nr:zinc finger protein 2-like [Bactrocera oleae]
MQCRACMKANCNSLIDMSVGGADGGQILFDYFNDCTQLCATASDSFPKTLCKTCTGKLRIAYSFKKCALESNEMFEKFLRLQKINTQSPTNSIVDIEDCSNDPLEIEFCEAVKSVKRTDSEFSLVEEAWNQFSSFEGECSNDHNQSQADIIEDSYQEDSFPGIEAYETDAVEYVIGDLQTHIRSHRLEMDNTSTSVFDIQYDNKTLIKKSNETKEDSSSLSFEETNHIEIEIDTTRLPCLYCKQLYSSDFELQLHVKKHLFKCPFCSKICTDVSRYYRHIKRLHNCSETEVPATQVVMKGVEIIEDQLINCKICNVTFATIAAYGRHLRRKHESDKSDAEMLSDNSETVKSNVCHGTISNVEDDVESNDCIEQPEKSLYRNIYTSECEQESPKENLQANVHKQNLKAKKRFLCSFCPRVLSTKRAVQIHERKQHLHIEPDLKECSFCQKKFDKAYLRKHIENVHIGERKFKCDICGNMYKTNDNVMRHRLLHTKDRNHPCPVCDKRFTEKSELKVHMRLHTGEKPYACHLCDRRFRIRVHLTYHLQQHARIKHKCNVCGKEFKHGKSLRNHFYVHTNIMPYTCSVCGYGSVKRDYFVKHMLNKHDKTMSVDELFAIFQTNTGRSPYVKVVDDVVLNDELCVHDFSNSNGE